VPTPIPLPDPPLADGDRVLRPWAVDDAEALAAAWADPEIACWTAVPAIRDVATARRWTSGEAERRARGLALDLVIDRGGAVVGEVGLAGFTDRTAEIGWWVAEPARGEGLATWAAARLAHWALAALPVHEIVAVCADANPASGAVAAAAGFVPTERAAPDGSTAWILGR
jgi:RimJ/RimL family protein N-acetyltransferase